MAGDVNPGAVRRWVLSLVGPPRRPLGAHSARQEAATASTAERADARAGGLTHEMYYDLPPSLASASAFSFAARFFLAAASALAAFASSAFSSASAPLRTETPRP